MLTKKSSKLDPKELVSALAKKNYNAGGRSKNLGGKIYIKTVSFIAGKSENQAAQKTFYSFFH